jgi:hypothetical protein
MMNDLILSYARVLTMHCRCPCYLTTLDLMVATLAGRHPHITYGDSEKYLIHCSYLMVLGEKVSVVGGFALVLSKTCWFHRT